METSGQGNLLGKGKLFGKNLWTRGKTPTKGKASGQAGYFLVKKDKTFFIGEYLVLTQNGLLNKWGNL